MMLTRNQIQEHDTCKRFRETEVKQTRMIRLIEPFQTSGVLSATELRVLSDS